MEEVAGRLHLGGRILPARLEVTPLGRLVLRAADGSRIESSPGGARARAGGWRGDRVLLEAADGSWAFEAFDSEALARAAERLPSPLREETARAARRAARGKRRVCWVLGGLAAAVSVLVAAFVWLLVRPDVWIGPLLSLVPAEREIEVGRAIERALEAQETLRPAGDDATQAAQSLLSFLLERGAGRSPYLERVRIARDPTRNAFAAPGGLVVLHEGLVAHTDAETLLGVLAHEIAHVRRRHATRRFLHAAGTALALAWLLGGAEPSAPAGLAFELAGLAYSRRQESEADLDALSMLRRAGVDPRPFARWLAALAEEGDGGPAWLSSHPDPAARAERLLSEVGDAPVRPLPPDVARAHRLLLQAIEVP